jgi:hypothetical protein
MVFTIVFLTTGSARPPKDARLKRAKVSPLWWRIEPGDPVDRDGTEGCAAAMGRNRDRDSIALVKAQKLLESVGENAEEAGEVDH